MGIKEIEERILKEAREEAEKILSEAEEKRQDILRKAREASLDAEKKIMADAAFLAEARKRAMITPVKLKAKNDMLRVKREMMDNAFSGALKALSRSDKAALKECLQRLASRVRLSGKIEIVPKKGQEKLAEAAFSNIAADKKKQFSFKVLAGRDDIAGGFLVRGGRVETDLSFDALLFQIMEDAEAKAAELLFAGGDKK